MFERERDAKRISKSKMEEVKETGQNFVMRNFVIYSSIQTLLE
jgi:hypothetical protein